MGKKILVATHNQGKLHDLLEFARGLPYEFVSLTDLGITHDIEETGATFEENALLKARFFYEFTGIPTIADDSGLEVDALGGLPGIYSRRFAGEDATDRQKIDYLLEKMAYVPEGSRQAAFRTVLAFVYSPDHFLISEGKLEGELLTSFKEPLLLGLPYSSIFYVYEYQKTVAELKAAKISYPSQRERALLSLISSLNELDL